MTTYNSYEAAKIANPDKEILTDHKKVEFTAELGLNYYHKCNPADYCVTVERFLEAGNELVDGDLWLSHIGSVQTAGIQAPAKDANRKDDLDNKRYILRAAALEKPKQISNTAREAFSGGKKCTKVEFVKVEDSIWHLETDFKCGELFAFDGVRDYVQIETEGDFTLSHSSDNLYRRIESPMTEREAFIEDYKDLMNSDDSMTVGDWAGVVFDKLVN